MSLDIATRLQRLLASGQRNVRSIQTIELRHPSMSQRWYFWREPYQGTINTEDGAQTVLPLNMNIPLPGAEGHMDQTSQITLDTADVNDAFVAELDRIPLNTPTKVLCVYREYLSDDLVNIVSSAVLQAEKISMKLGVATITAASPRYNMLSTGERYLPRDVPMLRGFV